jgi:hypothetical protein
MYKLSIGFQGQNSSKKWHQRDAICPIFDIFKVSFCLTVISSCSKADGVTKVDNRHPSEPVYVNLYIFKIGNLSKAQLFFLTLVHAGGKNPLKCNNVLLQILCINTV